MSPRIKLGSAAYHCATEALLSVTLTAMKSFVRHNGRPYELESLLNPLEYKPDIDGIIGVWPEIHEHNPIPPDWDLSSLAIDVEKECLLASPNREQPPAGTFATPADLVQSCPDFASKSEGGRRSWLSRFRKDRPQDIEQVADAAGRQSQFIYRLVAIQEELARSARHRLR